jgi:hypothetical protein
MVDIFETLFFDIQKSSLGTLSRLFCLLVLDSSQLPILFDVSPAQITVQFVNLCPLLQTEFCDSDSD